MKKKSNIVTSSQNGIHDKLESSILRSKANKYLRPIHPRSITALTEILELSEGQQVILDTCCGVGESSFHLASENPDKVVIGIDKSIDRLERKNSFKKDIPPNLFFFRAELLDIWYLLAQRVEAKEITITKQYILYPNPYPKSSDLKKRWHANPIAPYIFETAPDIEVRSNWKIYLEEFLFCANHYGFSGEVLEYEPIELQTPFERKFFESDQKLYVLKVKKDMC